MIVLCVLWCGFYILTESLPLRTSFFMFTLVVSMLCSVISKTKEFHQATRLVRQKIPFGGLLNLKYPVKIMNVSFGSSGSYHISYVLCRHLFEVAL